jgi:hypothetical protein
MLTRATWELHRPFRALIWHPIPKSNTWAAAILIDEFDPRLLESALDKIKVCGGAFWDTVTSFHSLNRRKTDT